MPQNKDSNNKLLAQLKALQAEVKMLRVHVKTGVSVACLHQVAPGLAGVDLPPATPYQGATIRIISTPAKKVLAKGKTNKSGGIILAAPPGKHLIEVEACSQEESGPSPMNVTVKKNKITFVAVTIYTFAP